MQSYAIANCDGLPDDRFYRRIDQLVGAEVDWIQLRAKTLEDCEILSIAQELRRRIRTGQSGLIINGRSDIAASVAAEGVHLPSDGVPVSAARAVGDGLLVGRSCHSVEDCRRAIDEGADYVLLGPVFAPRSKDAAARVDDSDLLEAARLGIPVFALGGMSRENLPRLRGLPLAGVAAITLFMEDEPLGEIVQAVREL